MRRNNIRVVTVVAAIAMSAMRLSVGTAQLKPRVVDRSDPFFSRGVIPRLTITVPPDQLQKLRAAPREYVACTVVEDGKKTYQKVAIKIKGAAGSYRDWDDRPALTLNFDKLTKSQSFHDVDKIHLNNSVQDESYLNEYLCADLFLRAGIPAPRVTHARVWLNGRDVGLYVLKEGFGKKFLKRWFADTNGNLYDGGFVRDLDADLKKDQGSGPDDRSDLRAVVDACRDPDAQNRARRLPLLVDMEAFVAFMAMERMTCHWDGYSLNMNNYWVYFSAPAKKLIFFPHGMDQMFGDPNVGLLDRPNPMLASVVLQNQRWSSQYRGAIRRFIRLFSPPTPILASLAKAQARLAPALADLGANAVVAQAERARELQERIVARCANLVQQAAAMPPGELEAAVENTPAESAKPVVTTVDVYRKPGRFGGWPANHGIWSWGNEILVGFSAGYYKDLGPERHAIDRERPEEHLLARSLDGGRTWKVENPAQKGSLIPVGKALHGVPPPGLKEKPWQACPGGIDFTRPGFALTVRMTDVNAGPSRFYYSVDRGQTWKGPFRLPLFGRKGIAARTDYVVNGKHDCTLFLTAAKADGNEGQPLCVRTTDGGKTWKLVSLIGREPSGYAIMPTTVRLKSGGLISAIRCSDGDKSWIDVYKSSDRGRSWTQVSTPVPDTGEGNPASMIRLADGRICITYGVRAEPFRICAAFSSDEGATWGTEIVLRDDGAGRDIGYPRSVQRPDGKVVTVYYFWDKKTGPDRYVAATIWDPKTIGAQD